MNLGQCEALGKTKAKVVLSPAKVYEQAEDTAGHITSISGV
jgi:hypothetical protein